MEDIKGETRQEILTEYAARSRAFSDAVEQLRHVNSDFEAFIRALAETGTTHRQCERLRVRLDKHSRALRDPLSYLTADGQLTIYRYPPKA